MFEKQVAELLRSHLGDYVEGLDNESLNIRVWKGAAHSPRHRTTRGPGGRGGTAGSG